MHTRAHLYVNRTVIADEKLLRKQLNGKEFLSQSIWAHRMKKTPNGSIFSWSVECSRKWNYEINFMVENIYCFAHYKPLNLSYISRRQIANIWIVFFFEAFELDALVSMLIIQMVKTDNSLDLFRKSIEVKCLLHLPTTSSFITLFSLSDLAVVWKNWPEMKCGFWKVSRWTNIHIHQSVKPHQITHHPFLDAVFLQPD